jgi:hypothetical protein
MVTNKNNPANNNLGIGFLFVTVTSKSNPINNNLRNKHFFLKKIKKNKISGTCLLVC